ncbi:hypothetical protein ABW17_26825 [Mycobacterium nebraskense]|uniref:hypothetical protein n=1 Tax=Mycobacterium nebraskense TaxID=244292 RepID=UPI000657B855|nr:hypothetical protein [Mycobacterium nebraskense]KLO34144.1 hypothetical protein ABW17_26825 [Mycobacterium nebraskense]
MVIRRIVGTALAAAALAGGVGLVAAPDAAAKPKSCTLLWNSQNGAQDEWLLMREQYGDSDKKTIAARAVYQRAIDKTVAAGC